MNIQFKTPNKVKVNLENLINKNSMTPQIVSRRQTPSKNHVELSQSSFMDQLRSF